MGIDSYDQYDATGLAALIEARELTPTELVEAAIGRIEAEDKTIGAVVHRRYDAALERAQDPQLTGPFRGVPVVVDDLGGHMADEPAWSGSQVFRDLNVRSPSDAPGVRQMLAAGFIPVARGKVAELGLTFTTEPNGFAPTRNPWDTTRSAGGACGGSAAAVATGYVPLAHATDIAGGARVPTAMTGQVALTPSSHQVETTLGRPSTTLICRTVRDAGRALDVMVAGPDRVNAPARLLAEEGTRAPARLRIGVANGMRGFDTHPDCIAAADQTALTLQALGHEVEVAWPSALDHYDEVIDPYFFGLVSAAAAARVHALEHRMGVTIGPQGFGALARDHLERGRRITAAVHVGHRLAVQRWSRRLVSWWSDDGWDVLVTPATAMPPFTLSRLAFDRDDRAASHRRILEVSPYTPPFSMSGQPAICLQAGWSEDLLPIGVQLVAAPGRDTMLLRLAGELEAATRDDGATPDPDAGHALRPADGTRR